MDLYYLPAPNRGVYEFTDEENVEGIFVYSFRNVFDIPVVIFEILKVLGQSTIFRNAVHKKNFTKVF